MSSNVTRLPVPLTFNELFLHSFVNEEPPCAALGLVEEAAQTRGFVAIQINESVPTRTAQSGFDFGYELLGNDRCQLIHFILKFEGFGTYDILLNPNNPLVRRVVDVMRETAQYFFFVFEEGGVTAFQQTMGQEGLDWFNEYGNVVHTATTTPQEYERGLQRSTEDDSFLYGEPLDWVCRENTEFLDLRANRFEVRCG